MTRGFRIGLGLAGLLAFGPQWAFAEDAEPIRVRLVAKAGRAVAEYRVLGLFSERFREKIASGLTSRVLIQTVLQDQKGLKIAQSKRQCELRLDVWDDRLFARFKDEKQEVLRQFSLVDDGLKACADVESNLVDLSVLSPSARYRVEVSVALDPVSSELRARSRQFTSNPKGNSGRSRGFFSSVARLFESRPSDKDRVFLFRSAWLKAPKAKP